MRSLNRINPTLSLFLIALNARIAQISAATSSFMRPPVPKLPEPLTSTSRTTVSSRSSSNTFTNGAPARAVTFQSMLRMSSPYWYSRTSAKLMPRPLKTEWYSPENTSFTRPRVAISTRRTCLRTSRGIMIRSPSIVACGSACRPTNPPQESAPFYGADS